MGQERGGRNTVEITRSFPCVIHHGWATVWQEGTDMDKTRTQVGRFEIGMEAGPRRGRRWMRPFVGLTVTAFSLFSLGAAAVLAAAPASAAPAPTEYVDAGGTPGAPCTQTQPCPTISAALSNAPASGATILVGPGEFIESAGVQFGSGTFTVAGIPGQTIVALTSTTLGCNPDSTTDGIVNTGATITLVGLDIENFRFGVFATGGSTRVSDSTVACNSTGIYATAPVSVDTSTIATNSNNGMYTIGGASTTIDSSTVTGNANNGVAIDGATTITNSTISGNETGVDLSNANATVSVSSSTISDSAGVGLSSVGTTTVFGTILSDNAGGSCDATINIDNGFNLDYAAGESDPCGLSPALSDVVEANPNLGPLQDNGGPTRTQAIVPGSPAYHAVVAASCAPVDQRGVSRPQPSTSTFCDIGAFEFAAATRLSFATPAVTGAAAGTATDGPIVVQQLDALGDPVPASSSTTITLSATPTGGVFSLTSGGTATSVVVIPPGATSASFFFGDSIAGSPIITAKASGLTSASQTETITPGPGQHLVAGLNATPQQTTVGKDFGVRLSVTALDGLGSPVRNLAITFTAPGTGPSGTFRNGLAVDHEVTNNAGVATATVLTADVTSGNFAVVATASGAVTGVSFTLTNLPSAPTQLVLLPGTTPQSATVATAFATAPGVTVEDSHGNGVPGVAVTFTAPASGPSGAFAGAGTTQTVTTDPSGVATANTFTANQTSGAYSVVASSASLKALSFALTNLPGAPAAMGANAGTTPQSADSGTAFAVALGVTVTDQFGNPTPGAVVTFTAPGTGPSGKFGSALSVPITTNAAGVATAGAFTANAIGGSYAVTAATPGVPTVSFTLTNISQADLSITKTGPATAVPGTTVTYAVTASNAGPLAAQSVVLTDPIPTGTTFVSLTQTAGPAFGCTVPAAGASGTISCTLASLANGAGATFSISLHVGAAVAPGVIVAEKASIASSTSDPNTANNSATAATTVGCDVVLTGSQSSLQLSGARTWCLNGVTMTGSITVVQGANVVIAGSTIKGGISATSGGSLAVCGSTVQSVAVSNATGFVLVGDPGDDACGANTIKGGVTLSSDHGGLEISSNTSIGGSVVLHSNSGGGPFPVNSRPAVAGNKISGSLSCSGDTPTATNNGIPNIVSGPRTGECATL